MTYKLKDGVYFCKGALRGAILDTNTEKVFSVNASASSVITNEIRDNDYWQQLVKLDLAEKCKYPSNPPNLPRIEKTKLRFIWFEIISDNCNQSCIHCYANSMPSAYRNAQGLSVPQNNVRSNKLSFEDWCKLISEGYSLGCRRGQFIGGEPFLYQDKKRDVLDLAEYAKCVVGYNFVEIFTNATLLTTKHIKRIKKLGINIAVSLYSHDSKVHDAITQTPGSHAKTVVSLRRLKSAEIPTRIATVLVKQNEHTILKTQQFIQEIGFKKMKSDVVRPNGRGDNLTIKPSASIIARHGLTIRPAFKTNLKIVKHYSSAHSCLLGKITITDTGGVLPCIFSRSQIVGNVKKGSSLKTIVAKKKLQKIWRITKDNVLVCQDCEYRYVCFDCRPLSGTSAQGRSSYFHAPYPRCTYNPYTGQWGKGVWSVNENGQPFYDDSMKTAIQRVLEATKDSAIPAEH